MVVWLLLILTLLTAYLIQRRRFHWLPPSSSAMLLGILAGAVSRLAGLEKPLRFRWAACMPVVEGRLDSAGDPPSHAHQQPNAR